MAYSAWSVVAGEQPTAAKWNILGTNDASFNDGSGLAFTTNNVVPGNALATTAIRLGYASITANFTTTSTTAVQVTSLTTTVTVPAGGRSVKLTAYCPLLGNSATPKVTQLEIWDGTVGSGTRLNYGYLFVAFAGQGAPCLVEAVVTPAAGSKTYNVGVIADPGGGTTATVTASATGPSFLLAELM